MLIIDYSNVVVLLVVTAFYVVMNLIGYLKKDALFQMIAVLVNIAMLILHVSFAKYLGDDVLKFNAFFDFLGLAMNIPLLVIIDEIETRRFVIKSVFENRYKK